MNHEMGKRRLESNFFLPFLRHLIGLELPSFLNSLLLSKGQLISGTDLGEPWPSHCWAPLLPAETQERSSDGKSQFYLTNKAINGE